MSTITFGVLPNFAATIATTLIGMVGATAVGLSRLRKIYQYVGFYMCACIYTCMWYACAMLIATSTFAGVLPPFQDGTSAGMKQALQRELLPQCR